MLDFADTVATTGWVVFVIASLLVFIDIPRSTKLLAAAVLGLWVGTAAAAANAGWLSLNKPFPIMGAFVAFPLLVAALVATSPGGRRALLSLPLPFLVGVNIGRVFAVSFLVLAAQGRLSGPFPYSAGLGDIITGLAAIPLLRALWAKQASASAIYAWNAFGMADLVAATALGVMSGDGSPLQVFAAPGSAAMQALPFSFVPTVLVPLYMIMHAIVWVRLRSASSSLRVPG